MTLVYAPDPILHTVSTPVPDADFGAALNAVMDRMIDIMRLHRGAGLSGVQVGDTRRIIVMMINSATVKMVNPTIISRSKLRVSDTEGCLSFPGRTRAVNRARQITVGFDTPFGDPCSLMLTGFAARCVQHEMDHLDGKTIL